jgi:hypothetical protein
MRDVLIAEFRDAAALLDAARRSQAAGRPPLDAFTPFPVEELEPLLGAGRGPVRPVMLVAGLGTAAAAYALEWLSAVIFFPLNLGARPLHSWPVFVFMPFEVGILVAGAAGFATWLWSCGLPRLNHPLFAVPGFERATQDRFFLAVAAPEPDARDDREEDLLRAAGALSIQRLAV